MNTKAFLIGVIFILNCIYANAQGISRDWTKAIGGIDREEIYSAATDSSGSIFLTGYFYGTVDFDPGPLSNFRTSNSLQDIFILKLDSAGNFLWVCTFGSSTSDKGMSIIVDDSGYVFCTGYFSGTIDFDPGPGTVNLYASQFGTFILKMDGMGNLIWARGTQQVVGDCHSQGIARDPSGNVWVVGYFNGTIDFNPGAGSFNLTSQGTDVFILKLNASGNFVFANQIGGSNGTAYCSSIKIDTAGIVYLAGQFSGMVDFDPRSGGNLTMISSGASSGDYDVFIEKMTANCVPIWAKSVGGQGSDGASDMEIDPAGNTYACGFFNGTADFKPGVGVYNLTSSGSSDMFIFKLSSTGAFVWAKRAGGADIDNAGRMSLDAQGSGDLLVTGYFYGKPDLDTDSSVIFHRQTIGLSDIFLSRLDSSGDFIMAKTIGGAAYDFGADLALDHSGNLILAGAFQLTADLDPGPGLDTVTSHGNYDFFVEKFNACTLSDTSFSLTACDYFVMPGGINIYDSSGIYLDIIPNFTGCDSVIKINLTVNYTTSSTVSDTGCNYYNSPSGNYHWSISGTYLDTIPNAAGCDSLMTINLTILHIDSSVVQNGDSLFAMAQATYQWLDCNAGFSPMAGDTNQLFIGVNGNYAVEIMLNGCKDTSGCFEILPVGFHYSILALADFKIYPNPSDGLFSIEMPPSTQMIQIINEVGQLVKSIRVEDPGIQSVKIDVPGVYQVMLISERERQVKKMVVFR